MALAACSPAGRAQATVIQRLGFVDAGKWTAFRHATTTMGVGTRITIRMAHQLALAVSRMRSLAVLVRAACTQLFPYGRGVHARVRSPWTPSGRHGLPPP